MPNLLKHADLVADQQFLTRVHAASVQAAILISGEMDPPDAKSSARQMFAGQVLNNSMTLSALAWAVAANSTILDAYVAGTDIPDSDIEYVVATVWDDVSGAARISNSTVNPM